MILRRMLTWGGAEAAIALLMVSSSVLAFVDGRLGATALALDVAAFVVALLSLRYLQFGVALMVPLLMALLVLSPDEWGMSLYLAALPTVTALRRDQLRMAVLATTLGFTAGWWVSFQVHSTSRDFLGITVTWVFVYGIAWAVGLASRAIGRAAEDRVHAQYQQRSLELAWELHDSVVRNLAVLAMHADAARMAGSATQEQLDSMAEQAREASASVRQATQLLGGWRRIPAPETTLASALNLGRRELERLGFDVEAVVDIQGELPREVDLTAGRIVQEALHNVAKHGSPNEPCVLAIELTDDSLDLTITNALGLRNKSNDPGLGLESIRHRAEALGGTASSKRAGDVWMCEASLPVRRSAQEIRR